MFRSPRALCTTLRNVRKGCSAPDCRLSTPLLSHCLNVGWARTSSISGLNPVVYKLAGNLIGFLRYCHRFCSPRLPRVSSKLHYPGSEYSRVEERPIYREDRKLAIGSLGKQERKGCYAPDCRLSPPLLPLSYFCFFYPSILTTGTGGTRNFIKNTGSLK
jgi:hypothetical protein